MRTPWDSIDENFRSYLSGAGISAHDFNAAPLTEKSGLKNNFDAWQHQRRQANVAYEVGAVVRGAKQSNGARGNVYNFLEKHHGLFSKKEGIQVRYEGDDLLRQICGMTDSTVF